MRAMKAAVFAPPRKTVLALLWMLALSATAFGLAAQTRTVEETSAAGNTYLAGGDLRILNPVAADLIAAGGRISVEREVGADAALAGGAVDVRAPISQDLRVAGGTVNIQRNIGSDLAAAGGTVTIDGPVRIAGAAWLAGGEVNIAGQVGQGAKVYGNRITVSGQITGDTRLIGREIVLTPSARIAGNLFYASANALPDDRRAQVSGAVTRLETPAGRHGGRAGRTGLSWFHPLFFISMLMCGMLLYLLFPSAVTGAGRVIGRQPVRSLLTGLALLFTVPPVAILFMITVVGLPIGFALLLLYPLTLLLGYLASAFFLGSRIAAALKKYPEPLTPVRQALFLALALLALSLALAVPVLGGLVLILAVVIGLGAWAVWMVQYRA